MSNESAQRRKYRRERNKLRKVFPSNKPDRFMAKENLRLTPGGLHGWHAHETEAQRRSAIKKTVRRDGYATTVRRLNVLATLDKNRDPKDAEKAKADMHWLQQTFGPSEREY